MSRRDTRLITYCIGETAEQFIIDKFAVGKEQAEEMAEELSKLCLEELLKRLGE